MGSRRGPTMLLPMAPTAAIAAAILLLTLSSSRFPSEVLGATQDTANQSQEDIGPPSDHPGAFKGYTLIAPMMGTTAQLIDMDGRVVHSWQGEGASALVTYFLENGNLFRTGSLGGGMGGFGGGARGGAAGARGGRGGGGGPRGAGAGGRVQEIDWNGEYVWDYQYSTDTRLPHHDIARMPNGNVLIVCWDAKTREECIAAGRNPEYHTAELPPDCIIEVKPTGKTTGEIVWEWYAWDHLVQDFDAEKPNYGDVAAHPELIDINYSESWMDPQPAGGGARGARGGGFGGGGFGGGGFGGGGRIATSDWTHLNAVAYNSKLDQIIVSSYTFSEFWIIDHSTTTKEAAGHTGGRSGKGGDLLYRWGNPAAYRAGANEDQKLFCPHNAHWIPAGLPGEGHILVFNNGPNRLDGRYSSVDELILPVDDQGRYVREPDGRYGPQQPVWSYTAPNKTDFYAMNISGAQRLPNGNTLICVGPSSRVFEVTADKETVWEHAASAGGRGGRGGRGGQPAGGGAMRGMGGMGGMMGGMGLFRAYRYGPDYPGLAGKDLTPESPAEQPPTPETATQPGEAP